MANFKQLEAKAKVWGTKHIVAAAIICLAIGIVIGAILA